MCYWNLWLTRSFSVFAEPGVDLYHLADHGFGVVPALELGGRVQLSTHTALTVRLGYPTVASGLSFLQLPCQGMNAMSSMTKSTG